MDAASGGFVAPFLQPDLMWDFRVRRVASINSSGHKYGLVYPGVGWIIWRDAEALPEDLVFKVNYLGGQMPTFALNFSRSGSNVVAQYYNFLRLGFEGYRQVQQACQDVATYLAGRSARWGRSSCSRTAPTCRCWPSGCAIRRPRATRVFDVSERLRQRGWLVPAYTFPANMQDTAVLRIVVRNGFSADLADALVTDLRTQVEALSRDARAARPAAARRAAQRLRALTPGGTCARAGLSPGQARGRVAGTGSRAADGRRRSGALAEARRAPRPGSRRRRCRCAAPSRRPGASCTARRAARRRVRLVLAGRQAAARAVPQVGDDRVAGEAGHGLVPVAAPERDPHPRCGLAALRLAHRPSTHPAAANGVTTTHCSPLASDVQA